MANLQVINESKIVLISDTRESTRCVARNLERFFSQVSKMINMLENGFWLEGCRHKSGHHKNVVLVVIILSTLNSKGDNRGRVG